MTDWGKGIINNIGWGQSATNNIGYGNIYAKSNAGLTLLVLQTLLSLFPGASLALALRLVNINYAGGLLRARAWNGAADQGQADIMPYDDGSEEKFISMNSLLTNLDATALGRGLTTSDVLGDLVDAGGANYDALVPIWYGQNDLGVQNNATQTTANNQPKIVDAGNLLLKDGMPSILFDGGNDGLIFTSTGFNINNLSTYLLGNYNNIDSDMLFGFSGPTGNARWYNPFSNASDYFFGYGADSNLFSSVADLDRHLFTMIAGSDLGNMSAWIDNVLKGTTTLVNASTSNQNGIGNFAGSFNANCNVQEIIAYGRDTSTDKIGIETNINNAFVLPASFLLENGGFLVQENGSKIIL
jgi:hypothetical protein